MSRFLYGLGAVASIGTTGAAYAYWDREQKLAALKTELFTQKADLKKQYDEVELRLKQQEQQYRGEVGKLKKQEERIHTFWKERNERYAEARKVNESHLKELPVTLRVMSGLRDHYMHVAQALPEYFAFDQQASKLHDLSLMLSVLDQNLKYKIGGGLLPPAPATLTVATEYGEAGKESAEGKAKEVASRKDTYRTTVKELAVMFREEPLVSSVAANLRMNELLRSSPQSLEELSLTFEIAESGLKKALQDIADEHWVKEHGEPLGHDSLSGTNADGERHSNLIHRSARKILTNFYVSEDADLLALPAWQRRQVEEAAERKKAQSAADNSDDDSVLKTRGTYLHTPEDVKGAISHVDSLLDLVEKSHLAESSEEQERLVQPVMALLGWQRAATNLLVQKQSTEALQAFSTAMEYSFLNKNAGVTNPQLPQHI